MTRALARRLTRTVLWAWLLVLLCAGVAVQARTVLDLDTTHQPVLLKDWGDYVLDPSGRRTPEQMARETDLAWQPTHEATRYPVTGQQALWMRFVIPPAPDGERWYLEVPYPNLNHVTLFTEDSAGAWVAQRAGDTLAVRAWPVPHRHPLLPVVVSAEVPRSYLLRIESPTGFATPIQFISESYLIGSEQRTSLLLGMFFGLAGLTAVVAVLSAVSLRDGTYALYGLSVALMGLTQASFTGIAGLHLWPAAPVWNDTVPWVLPALTAAAAILFNSRVVSLGERSLALSLGMLTLAAAGLLVAAAVTWVDASQRGGLLWPYLVVCMVAIPALQLWAWRRGDPYAPWFAIAMLPVLLTALFPLAQNLGLLTSGFLTTHSMQLGIAVQLPIQLVILTLRSRQRRDNQQRIRGMDRIDPATGLINEQVFAARLQRMVLRSQRLKQISAVLLIDVVNADALARDFGRKLAPELPLRVAARLLSTARSIDSVARLSDQRFGLLVEGPLTPDDAAAIGPRIVARGLMPGEDKPAGWVPQLRVAVAIVPLDGTDIDMLLGRLGALLLAAPAGSRRAVYTLGEPFSRAAAVQADA